MALCVYVVLVFVDCVVGFVWFFVCVWVFFFFYKFLSFFKGRVMVRYILVGFEIFVGFLEKISKCIF